MRREKRGFSELEDADKGDHKMRLIRTISKLAIAGTIIYIVLHTFHHIIKALAL